MIHVCEVCGHSSTSHDARCNVDGCNPGSHFPPLCCPECPCRSFVEAHADLYALGPLTCVAPGLWRSKDESWTFALIESSAAWYVYETDDEWPSFGERFATLREARREVTWTLADRWLSREPAA